MAGQGNNSLGDFLRSRRSRLKPEKAGIPETGRRRTPGLRRDEVASLAGISVEWYVKLEQGRAKSPSAETLNALASALQLSRAETQHLLRLGRGVSSPPFYPESVPNALANFVQSLSQPAWITGVRWDLLHWNAATETLLGAMLRDHDKPPNLLRLMMLAPEARSLFGDRWEAEARRMLGLFRAAHDDRAGDPAFEELIKEILRGSPEFGLWWRNHDVGAPESGRKVLILPQNSSTTYEYVTLQSNDNPDLKLSVLTPLG